jgi:hypothetical protein
MGKDIRNLDMKNLRPNRWLAAALLMFLMLSSARAGDSWQVWFDQAADTELSEKSSVRAGQSLRYACDDGQLATYYLEAGYTRHALDWLDWGLAYRQQYDKRDGRWLEENRPYAEVTPRWRTRMVTVSDRNRVEYRIREDQDDTSRYRNKLAVQYNEWEAGFGLKPYVAVEAFVDASADLKERDQTRFTIGIRTDPEKHVLRKVKDRMRHEWAMDYYVTRQRVEKSGEWESSYIAGVQLGIKF